MKNAFFTLILMFVELVYCNRNRNALHFTELDLKDGGIYSGYLREYASVPEWMEQRYPAQNHWSYSVVVHLGDAFPRREIHTLEHVEFGPGGVSEPGVEPSAIKIFVDGMYLLADEFEPYNFNQHANKNWYVYITIRGCTKILAGKLKFNLITEANIDPRIISKFYADGQWLTELGHNQGHRQ